MRDSKIREEVHNYVDQVDESVLKMIHAMLKEYTSQQEISDADAEEIEKRYKEYKAGKSKSYTVAEAKIELRKRTGRR